ncbi:hypothetical protein LIER_20870 [Lithospermum erythrorhizon]|uniref:Uncharacterized protein n=1 Tax=Lithospermum erythrorhizon TaxID=34254 RepID=A0AAV3QQI6_LITER
MANIKITTLVAFVFLFAIWSSIGEARIPENINPAEAVTPSESPMVAAPAEEPSKAAPAESPTLYNTKPCCRFCQKWARCDQRCTYHFCWAGAGVRTNP